MSRSWKTSELGGEGVMAKTGVTIPVSHGKTRKLHGGG